MYRLCKCRLWLVGQPTEECLVQNSCSLGFYRVILLGHPHPSKKITFYYVFVSMAYSSLLDAFTLRTFVGHESISMTTLNNF